MKWLFLVAGALVFGFVVLSGEQATSGSPQEGRWPASGPGCSSFGGRLLPAPRDLFSGDTKNADKAELCRLYGVPNSTGTSGDTEFWYYKNTSRDPITGTVDYSTQVVIRNGRVDQVNF